MYDTNDKRNKTYAKLFQELISLLRSKPRDYNVDKLQAFINQRYLLLVSI